MQSWILVGISTNIFEGICSNDRILTEKIPKMKCSIIEIEDSIALPLIFANFSGRNFVEVADGTRTLDEFQNDSINNVKYTWFPQSEFSKIP